MNDRGARPKHTERRHLQALRLVRSRRLIRQIPADTKLRVAQQWQHYVVVATGQLGRRALATVVWPWQVRPESPEKNPAVRVPRGRLSNPTALR
jgi:hypothetical protein